MGRRKAFRVVVAGIVALLATGAAQAGVLGSTVEAQGCGTAIGGSVTGTVTNNCGFSYSQVEALVKERTKPLEDLTTAQRETIAEIKRSLDSNDAQIRAALDTLGEKNIPPEMRVSRLVVILQQFKELRSAASPQPGDDAEIIALKSQVQQAIEAGERGRADDLLARIQSKQDMAQDRLAVERAATRAQRGQVALASLNYAEAAKRFADAARTLPAGDDYAAQRVAYLIQAGDIWQTFGDLAAALASYQASLAIAERLAKADPGNAGWQDDLAAALTSYQASLTIRERLAKADPGNAGWQDDLAASQANVGDVQQAQGDLAAALTSYQASLTIAERLAKADAGNAGWQRDLSVSQANVGDVQRAQGDLAAALTSYQGSLTIAERLAKADPGNAEWQRDLALSYGRLATVEARQGTRDSALSAFRRGRGIIVRLSGQSPDNLILQNDLAWFNRQIAALGKLTCCETSRKPLKKEGF